MSAVNFTASHERRQEVTGRTEFKFEIGHIAVSEQVIDVMRDNEQFDDFIWDSFARHCLCDWGDVSGDDKELNDEHLNEGGQLYSEYKHPEYGVLGIMTEEDRARTVMAFQNQFTV